MLITIILIMIIINVLMIMIIDILLVIMMIPIAEERGLDRHFEEAPGERQQPLDVGHPAVDPGLQQTSGRGTKPCKVMNSENIRYVSVQKQINY